MVNFVKSDAANHSLMKDEIKLDKRKLDTIKKNDTKKIEGQKEESFKNYLNHDVWTNLANQVNLINLQNFARQESLVEHNTPAQQIKQKKEEVNLSKNEPKKEILDKQDVIDVKATISKSLLSSKDQITNNMYDKELLCGQKIQILPNPQVVSQQPIIKPAHTLVNFSKLPTEVSNIYVSDIEASSDLDIKDISGKPITNLPKTSLDAKELAIKIPMNDQQEYAEKYEWLQTVMHNFKDQLRQRYPHIYVPLIHPSLGGVDIHLKFKRDGLITADFATNSSELLSLLSQNRQNFEGILKQSSQNNLINFHLKENKNASNQI